MKWDYTVYCTNIQNKRRSVLDSSAMNLTNPDSKNEEGQTPEDVIRDYGQNGWELVSVTPVSSNHLVTGLTTELLFTFKKPLE